MRTIYRTLLIISLLVFTFPEISAQRHSRRLTSDLHIGLNFATMDIMRSDGQGNMIGANMNKKSKLGMNIGINVNYKIYHNIQVQTGFYVTKKGLKIDKYEKDDSAVTSILINDRREETVGNYMQIPLCIGFEKYLTENFAFNINGGFYGAYGYKGWYKTEEYETTITSDQTVTNQIEYVEGDAFDIHKWKRWDYGLTGSIGFIYDIYMLNFSYEYGLTNVSAAEGVQLKNRNIYASIGFRF